MTKLEGIVRGLDEATYHARPELSSTEARMILRTPAEYRWRKDHPPLIDDSPKFDIGKAVHSKVLGIGAPVIVVEADDWRTKAAREAREEARALGKAPLLTSEYQAVNAMAEAVLAHKGAAQLFSQPGDAEVSVFATDPETEVALRGRFDFLPTDFSLGAPSRVAVDLKTTRDASPRGFTRSIADFGYDVQRAWYLDALHRITGEDAEFVFVAVEKEPPYLVAVHQLPTIWAEMGVTKARRARQVYAECVASGEWPGYGNEVFLLSPPTWLIYQHEEEYGDE
mgnify:CR=1 FL=1